MSAYYNENDPKTAAWLRELIRARLIADGEVDTRSIVDVQPADLAGFVQCHFFAGIGGWSLALRLAGWPDDRRVWTGSCPCQPWSMAGAGSGADDPRHLWPAWFRLISECRPATVFGEQVASQDGLYWLDLVYRDLEAADYALGALDLSGAGFGSPDIRSRLWFVADAVHDRAGGIVRALGGTPAQGAPEESEPWRPPSEAERSGEAGLLADSHCERCEGERLPVCTGQPRAAGAEAGRRGEAGELGDTKDTNRRGEQPASAAGQRWSGFAGASLLGSFWSDAEWIYCRDHKWRPAKSGIFPLASGVPARVVRLRGYGNSIKPPVAAAFIEAYMSTANV